MTRLLTAIFSLGILLSACGQESNKTLSTLSGVEKEIQAIENNLQGSYQIKETPPKTFSIEERMKLYKVPGISIAVVRNNKIHWAKGYGMANTNDEVPVNASTIFQAASISKPVAAMGILKLVQEGKLDLDEDVNTYLTSWKVPESPFTANEKVTLRRLITHTAGTTVHGFPGYSQADEFPTNIQVLEGTGNTGPIFVDTIPGSINRYSGGGYTIAEQVIEDVTGQSFADYMQENVLTPMGMTRSTYEQPLPENWFGNTSAAYNGSGQILDGLWHNYPEQAAAGLWTTPTDLAKFAIGVQEAAMGKTEKVINKTTTEIFLTKDPLGHGHGPGISGVGDSLVFRHGGKNEGYTCYLYAFAYLGDALVIMSGADGARPLIEEIQRAVSMQYGWNYRKPEEVAVVELTAAVMEERTGKYELDGQGYIVNLTVENNQMVVVDPNAGNQKYYLHALDQENAIDLSDGARLKFMTDEEGKTVAFVQDGRFRFNKITEKAKE